MRTLIIIATLLLTNVLAAQIFDISRESFGSWKSVHNKVYDTLEEEELRFQIYQSNIALVNDLNSRQVGGPDVTFSMNHLGDLTVQEFTDKVLMSSSAPATFPEERVMPSITIQNGSLPDSFDWRDHGAVTDVKDQGTVGTCWTFSTTGNIEGQWFLQTGKLVTLSEEQIVECDSTQDPNPKSSRADCGVFGGWPMLAYEYIIKVGGIASEQNYPYCVGSTNKTIKCYPCMADGYNETRCGPPIPYCNATQAHCLDKDKSLFAAQIEDWVTFNQNETEIAQHLISTGPLSIGLDASYMQFYRGGVWDSWFCSSTTLNHAVLLVGYGTEKGTLSNTDFWTVKNSWGASWGESGYFRIARGKGKCGVNTQVTTALLKQRVAKLDK